LTDRATRSDSASDSAPAPAETITPELVAHAEALAQSRHWRELKHLLIAVPLEELQKHPRILFLLADAYGRLGFAERALEMAKQAAILFDQAGDARSRVTARNRVGRFLFERGLLDEAEGTFRDVVTDADTLGLIDVLGGALNNLGAIASIRGGRDEALQCYEGALAAFTRTRNEHGVAHTYHNLALIYRDAGLAQEAEALFAEVVQRATLVGDEWLATVASTARAEAHLQGGASDSGAAADAMARQALLRFDVFASTLGQAEAQKLAGMAAVSRGDLAMAERRLTDAIQLADRHGNPLIAAEAHYERGLVRLALGQSDAATRDLSAAASTFTDMGNEDAARRAREALQRARS
jgi:tetratricopeptide (TPR) repeat protein